MKTIPTKSLIFLATLMTTFTTFSATITAISNGNWNTASTWNLNRVPICGDDIVITSGRTVTITTTVSLNASTSSCYGTSVTIYGNLNFNSGRKLRLASGACVRIAVSGKVNKIGNGGGNSTAIEINGQNWWQASNGSLVGNASLIGSGSSFLALGCGVILPIELTNFSLKNTNEQTVINWITASERDNDYFKIERSKDGYTWENIATVKGSGTTTTNMDYEFVDEQALLGVSYYRLTQYDFNGKATVLATESIEFLSAEYSIYPMPVNQTMFLTGEDVKNAIVSVYNSIGEKIDIEQSFNGNEISFNFNNVKNGTYFISIENKEIKKMEKIVVFH